MTDRPAGGEGRLTGKRIVVTRARAQAAELGARLEALGAEVIYCPAIRIAPPADPLPFQDAVSRIDGFDWVILTSVNGVQALVDELDRQGRGASALGHASIACVGPATAEALRRHGVEPEAIPAVFVGAEIASALAGPIRSGARRLLLARGSGGDAELPMRLRELGAEVTEVASHCSVPDLANIAQLRALLAAGRIDVITFTAPSAATYLVERTGTIPPAVALAAIGPATAARLRELRQPAAITATDHTVDGLVQAISSFLAERNVSHGRNEGDGQ